MANNQEATTTEVAKINPTSSEKFTNKVMAEFKGNIGVLELSDYQKQLVQGYFIGIDGALKKAGLDWNIVNLQDLALSVVHHAKLGLDMQQRNHLHAIPFKNSKTGKVDINLMKGYEGLEYIASEHSLYKVVNIVTELVYTTDEFKVIKKSAINKVESFIFDVINPFSRGEVVGGFGYIEYSDNTKNELIVLSMKDIEKRKPQYASAEFWGGEKDKWVNGKKTGRETIDGWKEEMCLKTIKRATYGKISIDPKKVNGSYAFVMDNAMNEHIIDAEIYENGNKDAIDITDYTEVKEDNMPYVDEATGEIMESKPTEETPANNEPAQDKRESADF